MTESRKQKAENLKNYIFNCCQDRATDYNEPAPTTWNDAKVLVQKIFTQEKGAEIARHGKRWAFNSWVFGLCFISPIMEDLTPYTTREKATETEKENDTEQKIFNLIFN